jgi:hypothetical protein
MDRNAIFRYHARVAGVSENRIDKRVGQWCGSAGMSKYFERIATDFDVMPLQIALLAQPELFGVHTRRGDAYGSPHGGMTDIWVRYNAIENLAEPATFNDEHESVWYPAYEKLPELKPIVFDLMRLTCGERLGGVLITKLPAGGKIAPHTDKGWHASYYDKFYLPIQNDEGATFEWEDGVISPQLGECYWFDNSVPHWVNNESKRDRIALIICIKTNES